METLDLIGVKFGGILVDFPDGSVVKNLYDNAGDMGSIPGWGRSP